MTICVQQNLLIEREYTVQIIRVNIRFSMQSSSCQSVVRLEAGQTVYMKVMNGDLHASQFHHTSFCGYKID